MLLLLQSTPLAYAKVDKVDAEEARHLQARFLIHKVLELDEPCSRRRAPASFLARGGGGNGSGKARRQIGGGVRLKRVRLAARSVRLSLYRSLQRHLRSLRKLVRGSTTAVHRLG
ncbi:hypothetical protein GUJ93_ZPchr0013g34120 [Zizania palustris]|uniref:Uncharacterized protein n=1 Tax=Zizania palustris TaxID=103762 RepID=A0A8J6C2I5_ZIZPA|nr:hypothetical protein GUJ93_ZPchr0013g34120 [Zizania palustris]